MYLHGVAKEAGEEAPVYLSFALNGIVFKDSPRWLYVRFIPASPLPVIPYPFLLPPAQPIMATQPVEEANQQLW